MVSIIDPSIGDVRESPYMSSSLRSMPMIMAAANMYFISLRSIFSPFCQRAGIHERSAAATSDAETIASGLT